MDQKARQGDMGSLETKTKAELVDLLNRQEKLLSNKKRLSMLPDKGQKVILLAEKLHRLIAKHEGMVDDAADLFEKMDIGAPRGTPQATQNVFLKTDRQPAGDKKAPFRPYRTLNTDRIPEELERPPAPPSRGNAPKQMEGRPPEVSAVAIPPLRHPGTQAIDVKEAAELLQKQRSKVEALQAEQAADRLAERLHIQIGAYRPAAPGRYRDQDDSDDASDDDDDDDDDEEDSDDDDDDVQEMTQGENQHVPNG